MTGAFVFPKVQAIPEVDRVSLRIDGVERAAYCFGNGVSAPFLFPIVGPSGAHLTRMEHPTAANRRTDRSVWFGHENLGGVNFWEEQPGTDVKIRHREIFGSSDGSFGLLSVNDKDYFVGETNDLAGNVALADGAWHHVAAIFDGTNLALYVDGNSDKTGALPVALATAGYQFALGHTVTVAGPWLMSCSV